MGRRKERRLASISNAGRRVKLDLFAEPSGDLDGSDVQKEVGGNIESKQRTGLPDSPSSSGQQPQNPLLLLGQYSDDVDEELSVDHEAAESSLSAHNAEVADPLIEESKDWDASDDAKLAAPEFNQEEIEGKALDVPEDVEVANIRENTAAIDAIEQASVPGTSDMSVIGDVSSGWKIVMHEESNNYYYWNTKTGETSWNVPDVLAQVTQPFSDQSSFPVNDIISKQEPNLINGSLDADTAARSVDVSSATECTGLIRNGPQTNGLEGDKTRVPESSTLLFNNNQTESTSNSELTDACFGVTSSSRPPSAPAHYMHNMVVTEELKSGFNFSSQLICQSRSMLDRLNSLKGSNYHQGYDWTMKYIMEIHIRLSDYEALIPYETALLPYWEHSERQLKRLESAINEEIYQMAILVQSDAPATDFTFEENGKLQSRLEFESEAERVNNGASTSEDTPTIGTLIRHQGDFQNEAPVGHVSSFEAAKQLESGSQVNELVGGAFSNELPIKHGPDAGEDVDMDVDMEVEDFDSAENRTIDAENAKESPGPPNPPAGYTSVVVENGPIAPPPPDEEWIPPPPPDNEDIPPPPPDDPLEPSYVLPPSLTQTAPLLYAEQINMPYPEANFEYYGLPVAEVSNNNFYAHSDVALSHAPLYYSAVTNAYIDGPVIVNSVEPEAYNSLQSGLIPDLPVSAVASQLFPISASGAFDSSFPDQNESTEIAKVHVDGFAINEADKAHGGSGTATIQGHPTVSIQDKDAASPIKTISVAPATSTESAALAKSQSKGLRRKKRAVAVVPSLKSNKKVSSLVDKWKAAKEELLEDEEELETAYETLERKRQREIEEWHALQIASGEAKDNANFQPLGGDWRERIKRRRAQSAKSTERSSPSETRHDGNQQPDLMELSNNLPSGWQAYWDESSKKVYYGNVVTSETSWSRPK